MKLDEAFPSKWFKASDLDGEPRLVTIEGVKLETVEAGKPAKPVVMLRGMTQGFVLNKTNAQILAAFLGDDLDGWKGKKMVMFPTQAEFQGRMTDCIRVRAPKPTPVTPTAPTVNSTPVPMAPPSAADDADDVPF